MPRKSPWPRLRLLLVVVLLGPLHPAHACLIQKSMFHGIQPAPTQPALEIRPDSPVISYRNGVDEDMKPWVESLTSFIKAYEGWSEHSQHMVACSEKHPPDLGEVCRFQDTWLVDKCQKMEKWGYNRESPCVLLMLSKMVGWVPEVYETLEELPDDMPESLRNHIERMTLDNSDRMPKMVWVSCEGEYPADKEYIGPIRYSPWQGFPAYYFPFQGIPGYLSPIVAVQFDRPMSNVVINIECRFWAKNVVYDHQDGTGLLHFQLLKD